MNEIKFSHRYMKMPSNVEMFDTYLLEVFRAYKKDLSPAFLEYDTIYPSGHYPLPDGELIILLLQTDHSDTKYRLWTTIRRFTPEKYRYYRQLRGNRVDIVIEE